MKNKTYYEHLRKCYGISKAERREDAIYGVFYNDHVLEVRLTLEEAQGIKDSLSLSAFHAAKPPSRTFVRVAIAKHTTMTKSEAKAIQRHAMCAYRTFQGTVDKMTALSDDPETQKALTIVRDELYAVIEWIVASVPDFNF